MFAFYGIVLSWLFDLRLSIGQLRLPVDASSARGKAPQRIVLKKNLPHIYWLLGMEWTVEDSNFVGTVNSAKMLKQ